MTHDLDDALQHEFRVIRQTYFPRWSRWTTWTIRSGAGFSWQDSQGKTHTSLGMGLTVPATRTITIACLEPPLTRTATIIHECCHALTNIGHGKTWRARMLQAATRATEVGATALAAALLEDVEDHVSEEQQSQRRPS